MPALVSSAMEPLDALRKSLIANVEKLPLHPVDQYETFAKVHADGKSPAEIAALYATTERNVKQKLALGNLAPEIRMAWRAGDIRADDAMAFTVQPDQKLQADVFKKLKKRNQLAAWKIREALVGTENDVTRYVRFIGRDAFESAGGKVLEDLFSREDVQNMLDDTAEASGDEADGEQPKLHVSDPALLKKLVEDKIAEKAQDLIAAGWSWAESRLSSTYHDYGGWQKLPATAKKSTAQQREMSGCIIDVDHQGGFHIIYGLIKPGSKAEKKSKAAKASKSAGKTDAAPDAPGISMALTRSLNEQLTRGLAAALQLDRHTALATLVAGLWNWGRDIVKVNASGHDGNSGTPEDFSDAFKLANSMTEDVLISNLMSITGRALQARLTDQAVTQILQNIDAKGTNDAMLAAFIPGEYFDSAQKPLILQAIRESMGDEAVKPLINKPKSVIAAFALREVPPTGWLPPELRTIHYVAPQPAARGDADTAQDKPAKAAKSSKGKKPSKKRGKK